MSSSIDKWADIADKGNRKMKDQVTSFGNSVSQRNVDTFEEFVDRVIELEKHHSINAFEVMAYVLAPLINKEASEDDERDTIAGITNEGSSPLRGISRDQVVSLCNKHGLRTLEQLLQLIDRLQQAQRGTLFKK